MAENQNYIGVSMGLDVSDLKAGLSEANKQIQLANAKFKSASSGMENWAKSSEGLSAKIEQLGTVLDMQKRKLSGLEAEYAKVAAEQGENSEAARTLQVQIYNQQAVVNRTEKEFNNYSETLKAAQDGTIDLEKVTLKAGKVIKNFAVQNQEAATAADKLRETVSGQEKKLDELKEKYLNVSLEQGKGSKSAKELEKEIARLNNELNENKKKLGEVDDETEDVGDGFTVAKGAIAGFIANGLTKLVSMGANAIKTVLGLSDATREYRKTLSTVDAAAQDAGVSTDYARDKYADLMGVLQDDAGVSEGLNNLLTAGFDEKSLDGITASLEGAALKWKDTLKFEGLADSLQEWIGSGGESLTGNFAELLERMGYNLDDVKAKTAGMTDEQRRNYAANLLASEGLADVSKKYREQNADMVAAEKANVEWQNTVASAGEKIEPITTKIREGFTQILNKIMELVGNTDLEGLGAKIDTAFTSFTNDILPAIVDGLKWIIENKDALITGVVSLGAAFVAWKATTIIQGLVAAFKAWTLATEGQTIAQRLLNLAMNANPIGIVISLIAGLVTAFVLLWNKSEAFRDFFIGMWDGIKKAVGVVVEWIKENWKTMLLFITNPVAGVFKYLYENFEGFRNFVDGVVKSVKNFFSGLWSGLKKGASDAWNGIKSVFSKVGSFFSETFSNAWSKVKAIFSTGGKIFNGIKDGIVSAFKKIVNSIIRGINKVVATPFNALNKVLDKIRNVSIAGVSPFSGLFGNISVPKIPELFRGGVLKKGQVGLLEGKGGEAIIPLEKNLGWIKKIAAQMVKQLAGDVSSIKGNAASLAYGRAGAGNAVSRGSTSINAPLTVNYNGKLSRKEIKKTENNHYKAIKMKLRTEGLV